MIVIKRDSLTEPFDWNKIEKAVSAAFNATGTAFSPEIFEDIKDELYFDSDTVTVEDLQDQIEQALYDANYSKVGHAYAVYREQHKRQRDFADKKIQFIERYKGSNNTANATIDDNSNVANHNIAVLNAEIHKEDNQVTNYRILERMVKKLYPEFPYKQMTKDFNSIMYLHDSSSQIGMPYTYSSKEVVEVLYNGKSLLLPLDLLYDIVDEPEILVDSDKVVYQKQPWHLYVKDFDNKWTRVTHLTRKKRHRPLVRVKTAFGEDLVVTDNHPMIVDALNVENTVPASESEGQKQYRIGTVINFKGGTTLDLVKILPTWVSYTDTFLKYQQSVIKRFIDIDRKLGYIVGFFVGDGGYLNDSKALSISQKEKKTLEMINSYVYECFGVAGSITKESGHEKYVLTIRNQYIFELFRGYFKIQDKAQNKTLPYNILEFNEEFAKGCLEGLIDSDGTIKAEECNISIRLSSRACVLQCTYLFRYFGYSIGNTMQSLPFSCNSSYHTNYTIWGISATKRSGSADLSGSYKVKEKITSVKTDSLKYKSEGYCSITSVKEVEEESSFYGLNEFIYDITTETHTFASNNILVHNCVAITLYPFLLHGLKDMGGLSAAPKNIDSFCGMFVNLLFAISGQFKGAVATPGMLLCMDWFLRKEWGDNYHEKSDLVISSEHCTRKMTIEGQIHQYFQQICYSLMQPAAARGSQAVFWNISIFDKPFFDTMYGDFCFPDGTKPQWNSLNWLQRNFMHWLNQERLKCILTFPVVSLCLIYQDGEFLDKSLADFAVEEYAQGNSFFTYISDSADSLSSCCRLSSKLAKPQFNFTNGQLSEMTGSKNVITLNLNRIVQDYCRAADYSQGAFNTCDKELFLAGLKEHLEEVLERVYKYQIAYNECLKDLHAAKMLSVYDAGFIAMNKQYLTIGINGLNQASEFLGMQCNKNEDYMQFCSFIFSVIKEQNQKHKTKELMFNTEFTPCESASIKLYNRDKRDGYWVPSDTNLYASYIFKPNDKEINLFDKIYLHGNYVCGDKLDGGMAAHLNLAEHLTKEQYTHILKYAAEVGCKYFTFNIPNAQCDECGFITKHPMHKCPKCGSTKVTWWDRVIGYLTAIKNWSEGRQIEQKTRVYLKSDEAV